MRVSPRCASDDDVCPFINKTWPTPPPRCRQGHATADAGPWLERLMRCVCLLLACVLHGQRGGAVIGPGARNRRGPRPLEGCSTTCSLLHRAYIVHGTVVRGCSSAEARAEGAVRCRVQRCSISAVTAATAVRRRRWWADKQGGDGTGSPGCSMPSRSGGALNAVTLTLTTRHTAHGTRYAARYSVRLDKVPGSVDGQVLAPPSSTEYTVLCSARSDRTCVDSVSEQKGWCPRVTGAALRCAVQ